MKRLLLPVFACFVYLASFAQPVFDSPACFQVNDSSKIELAMIGVPFSTFLNETGSNHTWDYSATGAEGPWTSWTNPTKTYKFRPASENPSSSFPNSQINEIAEVLFPVNVLYSYSPNQDTLYLDGYIITNSYPYPIPVPFLTFPLMMNDSVYTNTAQILGGSILTAYVSRYWIYDGYGTLKLPYGNVANVARIRTCQVDSSTLTNVVNSKIEELLYFNLDTGIPVLRIQKLGETNVNAYYASAGVSAGIANSNLESGLKVYPNPVNNILRIEGLAENTQESFSILDATGRLVLSDKLNAGSSTIDVGELNAGLYYLQTKTSKPIRFIKTN